MARNTSACLASAPSVTEVRNHPHEVCLGQRVILVYNMSIKVSDFQLIHKSLQQVLPKQSKTSPSGGKKELFHAVWKKKGVKERTDAKTADLRRSFGVGAVE